MKLFGMQLGREGGKPAPAEADDFKAPIIGKKVDVKATVGPTPPASSVASETASIPSDRTLAQKLADRGSLEAVVAQIERDETTAAHNRGEDYRPSPELLEKIRKVVELTSDPEVRAYDDQQSDRDVMKRIAHYQIEDDIKAKETGQLGHVSESVKTQAASTMRRWLREGDATAPADEPAVGSQAILAELARLAAQYNSPQTETPENKPISQPPTAARSNMDAAIDNW